MVIMNAYELGKQAADPVTADPGTYLGRLKNMVRGSKVAPYALGGGLALGALYGIPKMVAKFTEPAAEPQFQPPTYDPRSTELLEKILARTQAPEVKPEPVPEKPIGFSADPDSDNYWRQVAAATAARRNRDRQLLSGLMGERR